MFGFFIVIRWVRRSGRAAAVCKTAALCWVSSNLTTHTNGESPVWPRALSWKQLGVKASGVRISFSPQICYAFHWTLAFCFTHPRECDWQTKKDGRGKRSKVEELDNYMRANNYDKECTECLTVIIGIKAGECRQKRIFLKTDNSVTR